MPSFPNYESLVKLIVFVIVSAPEAVVIETSTLDGAQAIRLTVAPRDKGQLIGEQGRIAKAIRTILGAAAQRDRIKVSLEIA